MKKSYLYVVVLLLGIAASSCSHSSGSSPSGAATLDWTAPTTNSDGSALSDLAGYRLYYGTSPGTYSQSIDVGNVTTYRVTGLPGGLTYYFVVTAYNQAGVESNPSNEGSKMIY